MNKELFNSLKDENGQIKFADAVYFDDELSADDKIYWLEECAADTGEDQTARINKLKGLPPKPDSSFGDDKNVWR